MSARPCGVEVGAKLIERRRVRLDGFVGPQDMLRGAQQHHGMRRGRLATASLAGAFT
jgi:hypothetical protein